MIGCLRTRVHKQPIIAPYFESENELEFYNLEASIAKKPYSFVFFSGGGGGPDPLSPSGLAHGLLETADKQVLE